MKGIRENIERGDFGFILFFVVASYIRVLVINTYTSL